jgi:hypothetical protein
MLYLTYSTLVYGTLDQQDVCLVDWNSPPLLARVFQGFYVLEISARNLFKDASKSNCLLK